MSEDCELIISFYLGAGTDHMGRSLQDILDQDNKWMENTHDYIQWLFPLYVSSQFNLRAPILTDEVREAFVDPAHPLHTKLQANFERAIDRLLQFHGFVSKSPFEPTKVVEYIGRRLINLDGYPLDFHACLREGNHNQLRITRMLRSMTLMGRNELAVSFRDELVLVGKGHLAPKTIKFWDEAIIPVKNC